MGMAGILGALTQLDKKVAKKLTRKVLRAGAKVMLPEVKNRTPVDSGALIKAEKIKATKRSRTTFGVQINAGSKDGGKVPDQPYYGPMVEFGTRKQPAQHFMRDAFEAKKDEVLSVMQQKAVELIDETVNEVKVK